MLLIFGIMTNVKNRDEPITRDPSFPNQKYSHVIGPRKCTYRIEHVSWAKLSFRHDDIQTAQVPQRGYALEEKVEALL